MYLMDERCFLQLTWSQTHYGYVQRCTTMRVTKQFRIGTAD